MRLLLDYCFFEEYCASSATGRSWGIWVFALGHLLSFKPCFDVYSRMTTFSILNLFRAYAINELFAYVFDLLLIKAFVIFGHSYVIDAATFRSDWHIMSKC